MRILFVSNFYPPHAPGGMEYRCQETVERMNARGHECHVLTSRYGINGNADNQEGVTQTLHLQADLDFYQPLDFFFQRRQHEFEDERALQRCVERFRPDIIFIWGMWNLSFRVAYCAEQLLSGKVAYAVAGYWFILPNPHEAYWQQPSKNVITRIAIEPARQFALRALERERRAYPLALKYVACVSDYVRCKLDEAGVLPHGARVIYNGIDPEPFLRVSSAEFRRHGLRLVYVGGLLPHKAPHTAIEALHRLQEKHHLDDVRLTLIGGGHPDYESELRERVRSHGLAEKVTFQGRVRRDEIAGILAQHDVFLFTSIYEEPIARSVMEAMAAKLPVVGTAVGGQREMLEDGVNALTYSPDDADGLAAQIARMAHSPELREKLATAGQQMVLERFTLERMVDEMEAWLMEIVG